MSNHPVWNKIDHVKRFLWEYIAFIGVCLLTINLLVTVTVPSGSLLAGVLFSGLSCAAIMAKSRAANRWLAVIGAIGLVASAFLLDIKIFASLCIHTMLCMLFAYGIRHLLAAREHYKGHSVEMEYIANHDLLTGLPNRRLFEDRLEQALLHAKRHQQLVAVIFLDLNRFKDVNDTLGHAFGDILIREAGQRLMGSLRGDDTVYRQGGDEFTILLPFITKPEDVRHVASRIHTALEQPFVLEGTPFEVTASMGIALYPFDGATSEQLMAHADEAMYAAKQRGDNHYQFYAVEIDAMVASKARVEKSLRTSLERGEFEIYYQPQFEVSSGRLIGMEAVIRWRNPDQGEIAPSEWMRVAEECGLMIPIGRWAIQTACAQARSWLDAGYPPLRLTVGVTASQFKEHHFIDLMADMIKETGLDPAYIELDLAEGISSSSVQEVGEKLRLLKAFGFRIAMDDLCTGLFTSSSTNQVPMDSIKLDSTLIRDLPEDGDNQALAEAIITMAQRLQLNLIAKGVETKEQLEHLQNMHCTEAQGKLFSSPLHPTDFTKLMKDKIS